MPSALSLVALVAVGLFGTSFASTTSSSSTPSPSVSTSGASTDCGSPLTLTLDWADADDDLDLWVVEPSGRVVSWSREDGGVGYLENNNHIAPPETYSVFNGISDGTELGEYATFIRLWYSSADIVPWTLTATVDGEVAWVEEGQFEDFSFGYGYDDDTTFDDDYSTQSYDFVSFGSGAVRRQRHLFSSTGYGSTSDSDLPESETFTVSLDSYTPLDC